MQIPPPTSRQQKAPRRHRPVHTLAGVILAVVPLAAGAVDPPRPRPAQIEEGAAAAPELPSDPPGQTDDPGTTGAPDADAPDPDQQGAASTQAVAPDDAGSLRPLPRPGGTPIGPPGALCDSNGIRGERLTPISGPGECGIERPVRVTEIGGVALDPGATLDCRTATALETWLEDVAKPAFGTGDGALTGIGIAASYVCRNVNYADDGDISEHGRGLAVDISRFERAGAEPLTVLDGWGDEPDGTLLADIHAAACGIFGTTIGPDSDRYHQDHFHYDTAERRRPWCP